ncbi:BspA family leucine-rich repeat surface protein, partial [Segatella copri]
NTKNVKDMNGMFGDCTHLTSLDITNFNTAKVTNMGNMFLGCSNLTSLDLTNFNTAKVTDMHGMFKGCSALTSLDLTNFNTAEVRDMNCMFYMLDESSTALTTIYVSDNFVTTNVQNGENMFKNCTKLKGFKKYFLLNTDHQYANYKTGYFTSGCGYAEFDNATGTLTFSYKGVKPEGAYDLNAEAFRPQWKNIETTVKKVVFNASFANAKPTICYAWFYNNSNLTTIEGLEYLNTEDVTNMEYMFAGCSALESLDLSKFNTAKVTSMAYMFNKCSALKSLNLSGFNTAKVTDMNRLFAGCSALESLDLSMFNTGNVTSMPNMFNGAKKLKTLNVSSFNTEKTKYMGHMFTDCSDLTSLDLSSFNTKGVEYVDYMFQNCSNLTTIYVSANFAIGKGLKKGSGMFLDCKKLKGFKGYATNYTDHTYANYTTGYFTKLVGKNGEEKIGATGETLTAENLTLNDDKDFVAYEPFAAKDASYSRKMNAGTTWGTLCLPFGIDQSQETECKFYCLTGIDNDCITLESNEGAEIPAGTPVLFKMNEGEQTLSISAQDASIVTEPKAGTNTDVNLVGSFTKIGGKDNQGLADTDYIIGKDKFWRVSDLKDGKGVGIKPMRAYIHPATASQARAAMLS